MKQNLIELIKKQSNKKKLENKILQTEINLDESTIHLNQLEVDEEERGGMGPWVGIFWGVLLIGIYIFLITLIPGKEFPFWIHPIFIILILLCFVLYFFRKEKKKGIIIQKDFIQRNNELLINLKTKFEEVNIDLKSTEKNYRTELKNYFVKKYDTNKNDQIDQIEFSKNFSDYLNKTQKDILKYEKEEQKNFVQQFVKISEFIEENEGNINSIFKSIVSYKDVIDDEINHVFFEKKLEHQIYIHKLLVLNGLVMINSLLEDDRISFYKIYEKFDKLNVFNSNFQNQLLDLFQELNNNLLSIIDRVEELTYTVEESFRDMNYKLDSLDSRLNNINNSIETQSLLIGINTYQNYKINKNTKSLR